MRQTLAVLLLVGLLYAASAAALDSANIILATPLVFEDGAEAPAPLNYEDFYHGEWHNDLELLQMEEVAASPVVGKDVEPATTTVSSAAPTANAKVVAYRRKNKALVADEPNAECPRATCPKKGNCAFGGGVCCGDGKTCCPAGHLCVNSQPYTTCVLEDEASNRCNMQTCKRDHKCPHEGVKFCCLGGISCCAKNYHCTSSGSCKINKSFLIARHGMDDDAVTMQAKTPTDKKLQEKLAKANKLKELNNKWTKLEADDKLAELRKKTAEEAARAKAKLAKMTPVEKAKYAEEREKGNENGVTYELNDDKASRFAQPGNKKKDMTLELTAGASFIGGALRIDCPNKIGSRAHSSEYTAAWDVGKDAFSLVARIFTTVEGDYKRIITKRGKEPDAVGYTLYLSNGTVVFEIGRNNSIRGATKLNDGDWHTVIAVRDVENSRLRLYVDGLLQRQGEDFSASLSNDGEFQIGSFGAKAPGGSNFCGLLKDVGLFKRVLNPDDIKTLTNDPESQLSMGRIRNEELLNVAAEAAKRAEQALIKGKKQKDADDRKSEAKTKFTAQSNLVVKLNKEAANALKSLNDVEAKWEKTKQQARAADNTAAREKHQWEAEQQLQKIGLVQASYDIAAEEADKAAVKLVKFDEESVKSTAAAEVEAFKTSDRRYRALRFAEEKEKQAEKANCHNSPSKMNLLSRWGFNGNTRDSVGSMHGIVQGKAIVYENGGAVIDKGSWIRTAPLSTNLGEGKTMEVFFKLDNSTAQNGGGEGAGIMGIQNKAGTAWDTIAYNQKGDTKRYLSASNGDERTDVSAGGAETDRTGVIHVAITYEAGGSIQIYRNGKKYRDAYSKGKPAQFNKDNAEVVFGIVHGNTTGSGHFKGTIVEARLYGRALTEPEVASSYFAYTQCPSLEKAIASDKTKADKARQIRDQNEIQSKRVLQEAKSDEKVKKSKRAALEKSSELRAKSKEAARVKRVKAEETDTRTNLLRRAKQCRKKLTRPSKNAGKFAWPVFNYAKGRNFVHQWSFNSRATITGDFNGDGRDDFARLGATLMYLFISKGDGTYWQPVYRYPKGWNFQHDESVWTTLPAIDLNGDKRMDIVRTHYKKNIAFISVGDHNTCFFRDGDIPEKCFRITTFKYPSHLNFKGTHSFNVERRTVVGDFNADGRHDFARITANAIYFFISKGDGQFYTPHFALPKGLNIGEDENAVTTLTGNFNGNCQTSFVFTWGKYQHALLNEGTDVDCWFKNGWIKNTCFKLTQHNYPATWNFRKDLTFNSRATIVGDFNGDGLADYARMSDKRMFLFINRGKGAFSHPVYNYPATWDFTHNEKIWTTLPPGDFDGDGRTDIIRTYYTYNHGFYSRGSDAECWFKEGNIKLDCFLITTFYYPDKWHFSGQWAFSKRYQPMVGDFNGDKKDDFINAGGGTFNHQFFSL